MSFSPCPFCLQDIRSSELEWHANNHFVDEELAKDMELAKQIALASTSPPRTLLQDNQMDDDSCIEFLTEENPTTSSSINNARMIDHGDTLNQEKISCLVSLQIRSTFYKVEGGVMALLRRCLELETGNSVSIISGEIDHFQSVQSEDTGWGCGWRNIQMLCSNMLRHRQEAREVLFGGSGFIPDIPSLQRWLEIAWERGFDTLGSSQFDHSIYGTSKWIGATECAALFRSLGLRARIVDFGTKEIEPLFLSVNGAKPGRKTRQLNNGDKRKVEQVYGPMDKFLHGRPGGINQAELIVKRESKQIGIHGGDLPSASNCKNNYNSTDANQELNKHLTGKLMGHQVLMDWIWNYFSEEKFNKSINSQRVIVSERTPLYFQHDGHSRTIVGIQVKETQPGKSKQYSLLILDPGHKTDALERTLKRNAGWQRLIKRGMHTLKKPQYQLHLYIIYGMKGIEGYFSLRQPAPEAVIHCIKTYVRLEASTFKLKNDDNRSARSILHDWGIWWRLIGSYHIRLLIVGVVQVKDVILLTLDEKLTQIMVL